MPLLDRARRPLLGLSLAFLACLTLAGPALASHEPPKLGLRPIGESGQFFDLRMGPGESRELQLQVANHGHEPLLARTYAADGYSIINGGFGAELFGEETSGTTLWLDYPSEELTIAPDQGLTMDFSVSVPEGTQPGQYITAVVAENVEPYGGSDEAGVVMEQVLRTVVAVAIDVPGPRRPALEIGAVGHKEAAGMSFVSFEVANEGALHLKPSGEFLLQDAGGTELARAKPAMDSVYAGTSPLLEIPLSEALRPGKYCAELSLADEGTGVRAATGCLAFTVAAPVVTTGSGDGSGTIPVLQPAIDALSDDPLMAVLGALAGAMVLGALFLAWRRRRRPRWLGSEPA